MMWREQRLSFSLLPRFSPQLVSREYEPSLFCLKNLKRVQKVTKNVGHNQNFLEGTNFHIANGEKRLFQSVLWKCHRITIWSENHWKNIQRSCRLNVGVTQGERMRSWLSWLGQLSVFPPSVLWRSGPSLVTKNKIGKGEEKLEKKGIEGWGWSSEDYGTYSGIWQSMWKREKGDTLDVGLDPFMIFFLICKPKWYFEITLWWPDTSPRLGHVGHCFIQIYLQLSIKIISSILYSLHRHQLCRFT